MMVHILYDIIFSSAIVCKL